MNPLPMFISLLGRMGLLLSRSRPDRQPGPGALRQAGRDAARARIARRFVPKFNCDSRQQRRNREFALAFAAVSQQYDLRRRTRRRIARRIAKRST